MGAGRGERPPCAKWVPAGPAVRGGPTFVALHPGTIRATVPGLRARLRGWSVAGFERLCAVARMMPA